MKLNLFFCAASLCAVSLCSYAAKAEDQRILVLPVEYKDCKFTYGSEDQKALADSAILYFSDQLSDTFICEIAPVCTMPNPVAYYGVNGTATKDVNFTEAVTTACHMIDSKIDFSKWDHLMVLSAGKSEADGFPSECIWPRCTKSGSALLILDGKKFDKYAVSCELGPDGVSRAGIGDFCHEIGHLLGLVDLYDVSGGQGKGLGNYSLMANGNKLNAGREPSLLSAVDLDELGSAGAGMLQGGHNKLSPRTRGGNILRAYTDVEGECFLFECRAPQGRDAFIGSGGLVVYHVDKSDNNAGYSNYLKRYVTAAERWTLEEVNCNPDHECAMLLRPESNFTSCTKPAFLPWSGKASAIAVVNIVQGEDGSVEFDVIETVKPLAGTIYQDAAVLRWQTGLEISSCRLGINGDIVDIPVVTGGTYIHTVEALSPGTEYGYSIFLTRSDGLEFRYDSKFTTLTQRKESWPFIYLEGVERCQDGSFPAGAGLPLRVFNPVENSKVQWYFDGAQIQTGADGLYHPDHTGILKAVITKPDGSREVLQKTIVMK